MAGISDFKNGIGFLYITDSANNIKSTLKNNPEDGQRLLIDGATSAPISGEILAVGFVTIDSIAGGSVDNLTVNGVSIIGASATGATPALAATDLAAKINSYVSIPNYTAVAVGDTAYIYAAPGTGSTPNGYVVLATTSGTISVTESDMSGGSPVTGITDSATGRRYYINANYSGTALEGDLTNAVEITKYIVSRGIQTALLGESVTIASGQVSPSREASLKIITIDTQGAVAADDLDTISETGYNENDILVFRGANASRIVTFKHGTGNLVLANGQDYETGGPENSIMLQYIVGIGFVEIARAPGVTISVAAMRAAGIPEPIPGIGITPLTAGGGSVNLEPGVYQGYQIFNGSPVLTSSWTIQIEPAPSTPYVDGDEMIVDYVATPTVGVNTVTIFGTTLTTDQAQGGRIFARAKYDGIGNAWYYTILYKVNGIDLVTKTYVDSTFEPVLGVPAANGYILSSTTGGVRSWIPNPAVSSNIITLQRVLTSAEILTLFSSPIELISAQGAGTVIYIHNAYLQLQTYGGVEYTTSDSPQIIYATGTVINAFNGRLALVTPSQWLPSNSSTSGIHSSQELRENEAVQLTTAVADPTSGNSDFVITIVYEVITL